MKKIDLDTDRVIELYQRGLSYREMGATLGCGKTRAEKAAKQLIAEGILQPRSCGYKQITNANVVKSEVLKLAMLGKSKEEIANDLDITMSSVYKYAKIIAEECGIKIRKRNKPTKYVAVNESYKVDSTLAPGETIECTRKVSRSCVYGCSRESKWLCNYALITKECRSIGPDGCDYRACNKYSEIGPNNPRLEVKEF